jgi:L-amino acid N-acyltransferase YncA
MAPIVAELELCEPIALRHARPEDCEAVWRWSLASAPTRSRRAEVVAFIEHARWFARRLADGEAPIWIVEEFHHGVGVVRLDPPEYGRARITISLAGVAHGRGIDQVAITTACQSWRRPIAAEVFTSDAASCACFEACGFRAIAVCDGLATYHWDPETR